MSSNNKLDKYINQAKDARKKFLDGLDVNSQFELDLLRNIIDNSSKDINDFFKLRSSNVQLSNTSAKYINSKLTDLKWSIVKQNSSLTSMLYSGPKSKYLSDTYSNVPFKHFYIVPYGYVVPSNEQKISLIYYLNDIIPIRIQQICEYFARVYGEDTMDNNKFPIKFSELLKFRLIQKLQFYFLDNVEHTRQSVYPFLDNYKLDNYSSGIFMKFNNKTKKMEDRKNIKNFTDEVSKSITQSPSNIFQNITASTVKPMEDINPSYSDAYKKQLDEEKREYKEKLSKEYSEKETIDKEYQNDVVNINNGQFKNIDFEKSNKDYITDKVSYKVNSTIKTGEVISFSNNILKIKEKDNKTYIDRFINLNDIPVTLISRTYNIRGKDQPPIVLNKEKNDMYMILQYLNSKLDEYSNKIIEIRAENRKQISLVNQLQALQPTNYGAIAKADHNKNESQLQYDHLVNIHENIRKFINSSSSIITKRNFTNKDRVEFDKQYKKLNNEINTPLPTLPSPPVSPPPPPPPISATGGMVVPSLGGGPALGPSSPQVVSSQSPGPLLGGGPPLGSPPLGSSPPQVVSTQSPPPQVVSSQSPPPQVVSTSLEIMNNLKNDGWNKFEISNGNVYYHNIHTNETRNGPPNGWDDTLYNEVYNTASVGGKRRRKTKRKNTKRRKTKKVIKRKKTFKKRKYNKKRKSYKK